MSNVKVCFVVLGIGFSGAENVLVQYLSENEIILPHIIVIYSGDTYEKFKTIFGSKNVSCLNVHYSKNELRFLPQISQINTYKALEKEIEQLSPDVIYLNNTLEVMLCKKAIQKMNYPFIGHVHDMANAFGTPIKVFEAKRAFRYCDALITVSEACKKSWNIDSFEVVYNGVPSSYNYPIERRDTGSVKTIGFVGMLIKRKGFDILADVINMVGKNVKWSIAYNIVEDGLKTTLSRIEMLDNVNCFYQIKSEDMPAFYNNIDILVIPSREDPLPTVAIEAMSRGKLVIGFNIGGIPELIKDQDIIVDNVSSEALCDKIFEYLTWSLEKVAEKQKCQLERVKNVFSNEAKRQRVNKIIEEAYGRK